MNDLYSSEEVDEMLEDYRGEVYRLQGQINAAEARAETLDGRIKSLRLLIAYSEQQRRDAEARADRAEATVARVQAFKDSLLIGDPIPLLPELCAALNGAADTGHTGGQR